MIRNVEEPNHPLFTNKDGRFAWRPFALINPVLYVEMVNLLTQEENWKILCKRFTEYSSLSNITCCSLPPIQGPNANASTTAEAAINEYWAQFEQESLASTAHYEYMARTDITNYYGSIYTHTISWALHGRATAKQNRGNTSSPLLGDSIDSLLQDMHYGQTNGIPQGNQVSDLLAELLLGYVDELALRS